MKLKSMKVLLAEFPEAEAVVQVRISFRSTSLVEAEGPVTREEVRAIMQAVAGPREASGPPSGKTETSVLLDLYPDAAPDEKADKAAMKIVVRQKGEVEMKASRHVCSFGPRGRATCACGRLP